MDLTSSAIVLAVILTGCLAEYQLVTPTSASQRGPATCDNCPKTTTTRRTTTRRTTTHSTTTATTPATTAHTGHTTAHSNHTTASQTTQHANQTTAPQTTQYTNYTTQHANQTTVPYTTQHANQTTAPQTTQHANQTTAPYTTQHANQTTAPYTTQHANQTTAPQTTQHGNHTAGPHTTAHSNHTVVPVTTQQPTPAPPPCEYFVNDTSGVCLRIRATFQLTFNDTTPTNRTIPPPPVTRASGVCTPDMALLQLTFPGGNLSLEFYKDQVESKFYLGNITVEERVTQGAVSVRKSVDALRTPLGRSFTCRQVGVELSPRVRALFMDIKVQAFQLQAGNFGREYSCSEGGTLVPIVVGIVLLVLIVVVVVAYLIARRKTPRGYERL